MGTMGNVTVSGRVGRGIWEVEWIMLDWVRENFWLFTVPGVYFRFAVDIMVHVTGECLLSRCFAGHIERC